MTQLQLQELTVHRADVELMTTNDDCLNARWNMNLPWLVVVNALRVALGNARFMRYRRYTK